jgi:ferredoxin-thioredoxin reductase catalytic chain
MARDDDMSPEERAIAVEKATKAMTAFTNKYLENTGTKLCSDLAIPAVVIKGLAEHKVSLGAPLCPCRFYDDKEAEAKDGFWNCPCVPMRERHECHCMLFLKEDNDFAGDEKVITFDDVTKLSTEWAKGSKRCDSDPPYYCNYYIPPHTFDLSVSINAYSITLYSMMDVTKHPNNLT